MSREDLSWLNRNVLVGFTERRGHAWHYRQSDQGDEPNHYTGPVPIADVKRRLFFWTAERTIAAGLVPVDGPGYDQAVKVGNDWYRVVVIPQDNYWLRSDDDARLGHHSKKYEGHQYSDALLDAVDKIVSDSDFGVASAGLLAGGARAWVQIELPDSIETPCGFVHRPALLAATSFDSYLSTRYRLVDGAVVCDNTLDAALLENVPEVKVRHSKYSSLKIMEAREALGIVFKAGDAFSKAIEALASWDVTDDEFGKILAEEVPIKADAKAAGITTANKKRAVIRNLYTNDERAATWHGKALGVVQAFNTYNHHEGTTRGAHARAERNMNALLTGAIAKADASVLSTIAKVTGRKDALVGVAAALEGDA